MYIPTNAVDNGTNNFNGSIDPKKNDTENNERTFETQLKETQEAEEKNEKEEVKTIETLEALVKDILSLLRTGLTVEELKQLEELLQKMRERMKDKASSGSASEIKEMMNALEKAIAEFQKRIGGEAIIKTNNDNTKESTDMQTRIDAAMEAINELKKGNVTASTPTHNYLELKLREEMQS